MKHVTYAAVAAMTLGGVAFLGCEKDDTTTARRTTTTTTSGTTTTSPAVDVNVDVNKEGVRSTADRTGDALHRGAEKTGEVLANAADKTKEVAKDVGGKINDAAHRTGDAASRTVDRATDSAQQAGARGTAQAPDAEGIRDVLAQVTEASLTKGGLDDMVERFVDADRNRLGQDAELKANHADLDGRIDQFQKDWKAKYGKDFNFKNEEAALPEGMFSVTQGEIARTDGQTGTDSPASPAADTNRNDAGRNIATIQVAASGGAPALMVPMIHEAPDRWKIDVPDTLTAAKLKQNVLDHLTMADNPSQWPEDVNQGYALVAHHVLMAVMDKPAK